MNRKVQREKKDVTLIVHTLHWQDVALSQNGGAAFGVGAGGTGLGSLLGTRFIDIFPANMTCACAVHAHVHVHVLCLRKLARSVFSSAFSRFLSHKAYRLLQETPRWIRRLVATIPVRMVPACLPVRLDVRFLQALVGPRTRSFLATVLLLALGFTVFYLADAQELSIIDALCLLTTSRTPTPHPRLIANSLAHAGLG